MPHPTQRQRALVQWTASEWDRLAKMLTVQNPTLSWTDRTDVTGISTEMLKAAMVATLPRNRHREVRWPSDFKKGLIAALQRLAQEPAPVKKASKVVRLPAPIRAAAASDGAEPAAAAAPAEQVEEGKMDQAAPVAAAAPQDDGAATGAKARKTVKGMNLVRWNDAEVSLLAEELARQRPAQILEWVANPSTLQHWHVTGAQSVLPAHRQRKMVGMTGGQQPLRQRLHERFVAMHQRALAEQDAEAHRRQLEDAASEQERTRAEQALHDLAQAQAELAAAAAREAELVAQLTTPPSLEALLSQTCSQIGAIAARAFIGAFVTELSSACRADIPAALAQALAGAAPLTELASSAANKMAQSQRPSKIGLMGPMAAQLNELVRSFPQFEFVCVQDRVGEVGRLKHCDKVLAMTDFINHPMTHAAKRLVGDRLVLVPGGVSSLKRQLDIMMKSGSLSPLVPVA